jgi:hypothetical protein
LIVAASETTEKDLFNIEAISSGNEDIILGWLDASAHFPNKTEDDKL